MSDFSTQRGRLVVLLDSLIDLGLQAEERQQLNGLLREHAEARSEYRKYLAFHASLTWEGRIEAAIARTLQELDSNRLAESESTITLKPLEELERVDSPYDEGLAAMLAAPLGEPLVVPQLRHDAGSRGSMFGWVSAAFRPFLWPATWSIGGCAAAFTLYVVLISWGMLDRPIQAWRQLTQADRAESAPEPSEISAPDSAVIMASESAIWRDAPVAYEEAAPAPGQPVEDGEVLDLASGLVELKLGQGVTLVVEGPAAWSIDGENRATLRRGKLVATVPKQAVGFTLETPTARIVDLGTRFGVDVAEDGSADVHVLTGAIDLVESAAPAGAAPRRLGVGQSTHITASGSSEAAAPDLADRFEDLADHKLSATVRPPSDAERYAACVRALRPLVYLPIRRSDGMTFTGGEKQRYVARFTRTEGPGEAWEDSPFGEALRFRGPEHTDRVTLDPATPADPPLTFSRGDQPGHPFSVVLWARCRPGHHTGTLIAKGAGFREQFILDTVDDRFRFVALCAQVEPISEVYSSTFCSGSWQHVAGVFDPARRRVAIYVDGLPCGTEPLKEVTLHATDETTYIGNRPFEDDQKRLTLDGAIDEIAIFDRALEAYEISALYRLLITTPSTGP